jgi:hypothetical protein
MKIYIAGKITGDKNYKTKFKRAEKLLRSLGHSVMNPAWIAPSDDFTWTDYMQISGMMQARCNAVYFLKDWKESEGAKIEFKRCHQLNQTAFFEDSAFGLEELKRSPQSRKNKNNT